MLRFHELQQNPVSVTCRDENGATYTVVAIRLREGIVKMTCQCQRYSQEGWCRHCLAVFSDCEVFESKKHREAFEQLVGRTYLEHAATKLTKALDDFAGAYRKMKAVRPTDVDRGQLKKFAEQAYRAGTWSWTRSSDAAGSITVRVEDAAVVLIYRSCRPGSDEWKSIQQRVPISLTACHYGGQRAWFLCPVYCNGRHCGRRVAVLYAAGDLFACRHCYGLAYASQQESRRFISRSRKIRMRLGGSPDLLQPFPKRPRGMHQRTYMHLRARDLSLLKASVGALHKRLSR